MPWGFLTDPSLWTGAGGGGVIGLVTGVVTRRTGRIAKLEAEVEACKERDARVIVIEAGFRLVVGGLMRERPNSPELRMCADLLNRVLPLKPGETDLSAFKDLMAELDKVPSRKGGGNEAQAD